MIRVAPDVDVTGPVAAAGTPIAPAWAAVSPKPPAPWPSVALHSATYDHFVHACANPSTANAMGVSTPLVPHENSSNITCTRSISCQDHRPYVTALTCWRKHHLAGWLTVYKSPCHIDMHTCHMLHVCPMTRRQRVGTSMALSGMLVAGTPGDRKRKWRWGRQWARQGDDRGSLAAGEHAPIDGAKW